MKKLGEGTYGKVIQSDKFPNLAVKIISCENLESIIKETTFLCSLQHPNIISAEAISIDDEGNCRICMPRYDGDLSSIISKLTPQNIVTIATQIIRGVEYLHRMDIIHSDLKPGNILVTKEFAVSICDLGISRIYNSGNMLSHIQTRNYRAPEVNSSLQTSYLTHKVDMWSIGCILFEMINGRPFIDGNICESDVTINICQSYQMGIINSDREYRYKNLSLLDKEDVSKRLINLLHNDKIALWDNSKCKDLLIHYVNLMSMCLMPNRKKRINSKEALKYALMINYMMANDGNSIPKSMLKKIYEYPKMIYPVKTLSELSIYNMFPTEDKALFISVSLRCANHADYLYKLVQRKIKSVDLMSIAYGSIFISICLFGENYKDTDKIILKKYDIEDIYRKSIAIMNWLDYKLLDFPRYIPD